MQGTQVRALVQEDPTCRGAAKPVRHNYWARTPRAHAPQQEKPPQWEARAPQQRVAPAHHNSNKACVCVCRTQQQRPNAAKNK